MVAPIRFATKRCRSGCTVRSFFPTMYQLGFDLHAVPSSFWLNRSASGTPWVAQTSFCSCSGKSPAKHAQDGAREIGTPDTRPVAGGWESPLARPVLGFVIDRSHTEQGTPSRGRTLRVGGPTSLHMREPDYATGHIITVNVITPCVGWTVVPATSAEPEGPVMSTAYLASRNAGCL